MWRLLRSARLFSRFCSHFLAFLSPLPFLLLRTQVNTESLKALEPRWTQGMRSLAFTEGSRYILWAVECIGGHKLHETEVFVLDLKWIREDPARLDAGLKKRGMPPLSEEVLLLDQKRRHAVMQLQALQKTRNALACQVGEAKRQGQAVEDLVEKATHLREELALLEDKAAVFSKGLTTLLETAPNIPAFDVPGGADASGNVEVKIEGEKPIFSFAPKSHEVLGKNLGGMDFESASRLSGARFVTLKGDLARLERALAAFMLDIHTKEFGYQEVSPPYLVREGTVYGVGQLPKFKDDLFCTTDGRWLISTAEVSLTNLVREQILEEKALPLRYTAYTPCFRSEAGAAGRDTHGMIRLHQFSKVELVHITTPGTSCQEFEHLLRAAQTILQRLNLPYRLVLLCGGDMGFCSQKTYDLEVWLPSQKMYREISSCSHCGDFQARRMGARVRLEGGNEIGYAHTLNGSGLAVGRTLVAILENFQQEDGSILIPDALSPYMGGQKRIEKNGR